ncbi:MAG: hypothetical protein LBQ15_13585 [Clostridium sp.]|jgi:hypothetical protein|nr:hypothetical protein [Clostridium sp.]
MKRTLTIALTFILAISIMTACGEANEPDNRIGLPSSSKEYKGDNYQNVVAELQAVGFTNIETAVLDDLITGWLTSDGEVESVAVDGKTDFGAGSKYVPDTKIVVTYHTFPVKETPDDKQTSKPSETPEATYHTFSVKETPDDEQTSRPSETPEAQESTATPTLEAIEAPVSDEIITVSETQVVEATAIPTPETTPEPTPEPAPEPTPTPEIKKEGVYVPGNNAVITLQGVAGVEYSITYWTPKNNKSTAQGLEKKTAGADGKVTWEWKIGSGTSSGTGKIEIRGSDGSVFNESLEIQ